MADLPVVAPGYEDESPDETPEGCLMNLCVLDRGVLTEAMEASMKRPFFRVLGGIELAVLLAAAGLLIWAVAARQSVLTVLEAIFLLAMAGFFYLQQFVLYPRRAVKNQLLRQALEDGAEALENRLWFTPENVANRRGEGDQLLHMPYENIKAVTETERLIVLTTRRNRLIPLDKAGFTNGTAEDLYRLLEDKCHLRPNRKKVSA